MKIRFLLVVTLSFIQFQVLAKLPSEIKLNDHAYTICKNYTVKYAMFFKVVDVGLYLKECNSKINTIDSSDKVVRFHYHLDVKRKIFIDAAEEFYLKNHAGNKESSELLDELNRFNQAYQDISEDDFYDLHHNQNQSLSLFKNDEILIKSDISEFAMKYFHIWFGEKPAVKSLKRSFQKQ